MQVDPNNVNKSGTNHTMFVACVKKVWYWIVLSMTTVGTDVSGMIITTFV